MKAKIQKAIFYTKWLLSFSTKILIAIIAAPFSKRAEYRDLWLISERPDEARDNGYWLYKYIVENHPEINVRYVLAKTSPDYAKMPAKENLIEPKSFAHYLAFVKCQKAIATEMHGASPGKAFCIPFLPLMPKKQTIFLQHGVTKDIIPLRNKLDLIVSVSNQEKLLLEQSNPKTKNNIKILGFCRYDTLTDQSDKQSRKIILIMPTFRRWLRDISRLPNAAKEFQKTEYFKKWNDLLRDEHFSKMLGENTKVIFYLHHELQCFSDLFTPKSDHIIIAHQKDYDVQSLLKKSSLLITDYSSVFFDFAYMKKPVIFFQFDQTKFFKDHYKGTPKNYSLGARPTASAGLLSEIKSAIARNFTMEEKYLVALDTHFAYCDRDNTARNFAAIKGESK